MKKRIVVVVVAVVLMLTACGKPKDEQTRPEGSSGYTKYRYYANKKDEKIVQEVYENLITEKYYEMCDEEGKMATSLRSYYDETGKNIQKSVSWGPNDPAVVREYDKRGRLVSETTMYEDETARKIVTTGFVCPEVYINYDMNPIFENVPVLCILQREINTASITTTYTYKGDSYDYSSVRTVTAEGTVLASLELGEGGMLLSEKLDGDNLQYEETYNAADRTAAFQGVIEGERFTGEKRYDAEGRFELISLDAMDEYLHSEVRYEYEGDTHWESTWYQEYEVVFENGEIAAQIGEQLIGKKDSGKKGLHLMYRRQLDPDGRLLVNESYEFDERTGKDVLMFRSTLEVSPDGKTEIVKTRNYWSVDSRVRDEYSEYEERTEYTETETITTFIYDGEVTEIQRVSEPEIPEIAGKVRYTVTETGPESDAPYVTEQYEVCIMDYYSPWWEKWIVYSKTETVGGIKNKIVTATFDEEGHLKEVETHGPVDEYQSYDEDTVFYDEYDAKGRMLKRREVWKSTKMEIITEWEYWEA